MVEDHETTQTAQWILQAYLLTGTKQLNVLTPVTSYMLVTSMLVQDAGISDGWIFETVGIREPSEQRSEEHTLLIKHSFLDIVSGTKFSQRLVTHKKKWLVLKSNAVLGMEGASRLHPCTLSFLPTLRVYRVQYDATLYRRMQHPRKNICKHAHESCSHNLHTDVMKCFIYFTDCKHWAKVASLTSWLAEVEKQNFQEGARS